MENSFQLGGIARIVQFGKNGKKLKSTPNGLAHVEADELTLSNAQFADPVTDQDGVTLKYLKENVLLNWATPVQSLADLVLVLPADRIDKQIRYVEDELCYYQFDQESLAVVPNPIDSNRTLIPSDLSPSDPGRWIWTRGRVEQHQDLLGLGVGNDHPQYQLRLEKDSEDGYPSLDSTRSLNLQSTDGLGGWITSKLRNIATAFREWTLPDKSGTLALDDEFVGATNLQPGTKGLVPTPIVGDEIHYLRGDGIWSPVSLFKNTDVKNANYLANQGERVLVDSTVGSIVITLPLSPSDGMTVAILDVGNNAETNPIIIEPNGEKINNGIVDEEWALDMDSVYVSLSYSQVQGSWYFNETPSTFVPLSGPTISVLDSPIGSETTDAPSVRWVQDTKANLLHGHGISDITGLAIALSGKQDSLPVSIVEGQLNFASEVKVNKASNYTIVPAGNETLDCNIASTFFKTGGTATITFANLSEGQSVDVLMQSTGSAYVLTWAGATFRWQGATVPTPTPTASRWDLYSFKRIGGIVYAAASLGHA